MSNIFNHNRSIFQTRVSRSDYWDTHLYIKQGGNGTYGNDDGLVDECLIGYIDTTFPQCHENDGLVSMDTYIWDDSVNKGVELKNYGLTGMDNGQILFDKSSITTEEFEDIYKNSCLVIDEGDVRLHVGRVGGNNHIYSYENDIVIEDGMKVARLNGGFFQGFFQTDDTCTYKVLPNKIEKGWTMEFTLKRGNFKSNYNIKHEKYSLEEYNLDGWDGELGNVDEYGETYVNDNYYDDNPLPTLNDMYPENNGIFFYIGTRAENKWWKYYTNNGTTTELTTSDGNELGEQVVTIETNNKFITYNRTPDGLKAFMRNEKDDPRVIKMMKNLNTENYFIVMNRAHGGYTTRTIKELSQESNSDYDLLSDLYRNAMAFQIREDGSIGYKLMVKDCDTEEGYSIKEEWSNQGIVSDENWHTIDVRIQPSVINGFNMYSYDKSVDTMRLMFYVDGKLVLVTKQLPMLDLRMLGDTADKQETVPYNISLGGGTQGLCDVIYEDYNNIPEYVLYLEKEFGGSFYGYFKSFKFYDCDKNFNEINTNVLYERKLIIG